MGLFRSMTGFGGRDMAVDLGTANTLVYVRGRGIVLSEPSVVAIDQRTGDVHAVGVEAKRMLGRTPGSISAIRPLKDGVIADFDVTEQMLRHFIQKVHQHRFAHPRVVVCVPSGVTGVEKRAVEEATLSAGARQAYLIEEPMAAAIGAGLPVAEPTGNMIVDIGGGTTEVAVISLGGIVVSQSLRVGGDEMDEAIVNHIKKEYKLLVGQQTAEEIKLEIGSAHRCKEEVQAEVRGRDMLTGLPKTVIITSDEIRRALDEPVSQIVDAIKSTLDKTPPELSADIMDRGIVLAGGGALLQGLDERLRHETHMPVHLAESPLTCVAVGSGRSLEEFEAIHRSNRARGRRNGRQPQAGPRSDLRRSSCLGASGGVLRIVGRALAALGRLRRPRGAGTSPAQASWITLPARPRDPGCRPSPPRPGIPGRPVHWAGSASEPHRTLGGAGRRASSVPRPARPPLAPPPRFGGGWSSGASSSLSLVLVTLSFQRPDAGRSRARRTSAAERAPAAPGRPPTGSPSRSATPGAGSTACSTRARTPSGSSGRTTRCGSSSCATSSPPRRTCACGALLRYPLAPGLPGRLRGRRRRGDRAPDRGVRAGDRRRGGPQGRRARGRPGRDRGRARRPRDARRRAARRA